MTAETPEGWTRRPSRSKIDEVLERIEREAADHGRDYAAGMREARRIVETELEY